MREALHIVAREKLCAVLNFARFNSLVCVVSRSRENLARSRSSRFSLATARFRSRLQVYSRVMSDGLTDE